MIASALLPSLAISVTSTIFVCPIPNAKKGTNQRNPKSEVCRIKGHYVQSVKPATRSEADCAGGRCVPDMDPTISSTSQRMPTHMTSSGIVNCGTASTSRFAWYVQLLKSPDAPRHEKRIALRFIAHLVGNIHQPLHAGSLRIAGATALTCGSTAGKKTCTHCGTPGLLSWRTALPQRSPGVFKLR